MWSGAICYFDPYSYDNSGNPVYSYCGDYPAIDQCDVNNLCCVDIEPDSVYDDCALFDSVAIDTDGDTIPDSCPDTLPLEVEAFCREYDVTEQQWIFNISDFVGLVWDIGNNGSYNIQIRFYPL